MKKIIWGFFCALLLLLPRVSVQGADLDLYATAAVLLDADSGRVLFGKNEETILAMASTTKIMTCILVLENTSPEDILTVSSYAASMPKVKLYIQKGEQYRVRDLLYSLMLESHNDSAVALAEFVGKQFLPQEIRDKDTAEFTAEESKQAMAAFAVLMNRKAAELGCENTWFITPNGLDATETFTLEDGTVIQKEHCTTAKELARIMAYCIKESPCAETFLEITRTPAYSFSANGRGCSCVNHNAFLNMMSGALTGKTGFTNKAGYCYVGALERDGRTFVVALLACGWPNNKGYKWSDTQKLMQYGIDNYFYRSFSEEGVCFDESQLKAIPVQNGQTDILGETACVNVRVEEAGTENREGAGGTVPERDAISETGTTGSTSGRTEGNDSTEAGEGTGSGDDTGGSVEGKKTSGRTNVLKKAGTGTIRESAAAGEISGSRDGAEAEKETVRASGRYWKEGLLMREDEEIRVEYTMADALTAPVTIGTPVGSIDYIVDDVVYKREAIVTASDVASIDLEWCMRQVFRRFLMP